MKKIVLEAVCNYDEVKNTIRNFSNDERKLFFKELDRLFLNEEKFQQHTNKIEEFERLLFDLEPTFTFGLITKYISYDHLNRFLGSSDLVFDFLEKTKNLAENPDNIPFKQKFFPTMDELNHIAKKYAFNIEESFTRIDISNTFPYITFYRNNTENQPTYFHFIIQYFLNELFIKPSVHSDGIDFEIGKILKGELHQLLLNKRDKVCTQDAKEYKITVL